MSRLIAPILVPCPASTLVLLREARGGVEVLMVRREPGASFAPDAWVFPGGRVDAVDSALSASLALPAATLPGHAEPTVDRVAYRLAAIRECFEEAGVLIAELPKTAVGWQLAGWREAVLANQETWEQLVRSRAFSPATHRLHYLFRRITPPGLPRRFDTRFYVTAAPPSQEASVCATEVVEARWFDPSEALALYAQGELLLLSPTRAGLEQMMDPRLQEQVLAG